MIPEDESPDVVQGNLRSIGLRAVHFQEFLMRRAWGLFYGVWAADFLLATVGSLFLSQLPDALFSIIVIASGYFVSITVFAKARNVPRFRKYLSNNPERTRPSRIRQAFFGILIAYAVVITVVVSYFSDQGRIASYLSVASFLALLFAGSFGSLFASIRGFGRTTLTSVIATVSLLAGGLCNLVLQIYNEPALYQLLAWGLVVAFWLLSAFLSYYQSAESLGGLNGE